MVSKEMVNQYIDMRDEAKEIKNTIEKLKTDIDRITKQIDELEVSGTVKDKVYGGEGGWQGFTIEGFPTTEHRNKKNLLYTKKIKLSERVSTLEVLETELVSKVADVEKFICSIPDSHIRRIVRLRAVDSMSWNEVATQMGGGNTEDSVRMMYNRYFKKQ